MTTRITPEERERLRALALIQGKPAYSILQEGLAMYVAALPAKTRRHLDKVIGMMKAERDGGPA